MVTARKDKDIGDQPINFDLPYPEEQYGSIEGVTVTAVKGKQERKYSCSDGSSGARNTTVPGAAASRVCDHAVITRMSVPGRETGIMRQRICQGFTTDFTDASKSDALRVTRVRACTCAVAAISASIA